MSKLPLEEIAKKQAVEAREIERESLERNQAWGKNDVDISWMCENEHPGLNYVFEGMIVEGTVSGISGQGGAGKSNLGLAVCALLACGGELGPFKSNGGKHSLYIGGEDPEDILHQRISLTYQRQREGVRDNLKEFLSARSVEGQVDPLMELKDGNPAKSKGFDCIDKTIENVKKDKDIKFVVLDTLSSFYGLDENSNAHAAAWILGLRWLCKKHEVSILFIHHENKHSGGTMTTGAARGASAFTDNCRWFGSLTNLTEVDGESLGIDDWGLYCKFIVNKSNYSAGMPAPCYFKKGAGGLLTEVFPCAELIRQQAQELADVLSDEGSVSIRELIGKSNTPRKKDIHKRMKIAFPEIKITKVISNIIDFGLEAGLWYISGEHSRKILFLR